MANSRQADHKMKQRTREDHFYQLQLGVGLAFVPQVVTLKPQPLLLFGCLAVDFTWQEERGISRHKAQLLD